MITPKDSKQSSYLTIALLILAGEAVFLLPFVLPRVFRPTFLAVFQLDNTQLGSCFSLYGVVALFAYLFGGPIADRFPPRQLMAVALTTTALGGVVASTFPAFWILRLVYGYWGLTTIFLFWAAMLKATRSWGGRGRQGRAFGLLDGGRGLVSAGLGSLGVILFSSVMSDDVEAATLAERQQAFRYVLLSTSAVVGVVGMLLWFFLDVDGNQTGDPDSVPAEAKPLSLAGIRTALRLPAVWFLMVIVLCGYVGYKVTDDLSLYAHEVMLFDEVRSAQIGTLLLYLRPVVGLVAGLLADRTQSAVWIVVGFVLMCAGAVTVGSGVIEPQSYFVFLFSLVATCVGTYAIRSLYFAAMQEGRIPLAITGTAAGLISVIGFTPDIFMGPVMGFFLDGSPGEPGHQHLFWFLAVFSVIGAATSLAFQWHVRIRSTAESSG